MGIGGKVDKKMVVLLALAFTVLVMGCGIVGDLEKENWCQEQGYGAGIVNVDGVYYCAGNRDVRVPDGEGSE